MPKLRFLLRNREIGINIEPLAAAHIHRA
jgi:hypothetical protein